MWNWLKKPVAVHQLVLDYENEYSLDKQSLASKATYLVPVSYTHLRAHET